MPNIYIIYAIVKYNIIYALIERFSNGSTVKPHGYNLPAKHTTPQYNPNDILVLLEEWAAHVHLWLYLLSAKCHSTIPAIDKISHQASESNKIQQDIHRAFQID